MIPGNETEGHLLAARDLDLCAADEWQKFTAETIEIRLHLSNRVLETREDE